MELCILCKELKEDEYPNSEFNKEHVFPESIGGKYIIKNVCGICNEKLGRLIDEPFIEHIAIGRYRKQYNLKSRGKKIKDSVKKFNDSKAAYYYKTDDDGTIRRYLRPKTNIVVIDGKEIEQVTIDKKDYTPEKMNKRINRIVKTNNANPNKEKIHPSDVILEIKNEEIIPGETVQFIDADRLIILEAMKVAYEITANHFPGYIDTPLAKYYQEALKTGNPNRMLNLFTGNATVNIKTSQKLLQEILKHHFVIVAYVPKIGILALVRFFDGELRFPMVNTFIMSNGYENKEGIQPMLIYNDFKNRKAYTRYDFSIEAKWNFKL